MGRSARRAGVWATLLAAGVLALSTSSSAATITDKFKGNVDVGGVVTQTFTIQVGDLSVPIDANLDWVDVGANLALYLIAPGSPNPVAQADGPEKPKALTFTPLVAGTYKLRVKALAGASDFTFTVTYGNASGSGLAAYSKTYGFPDATSILPYGMAYDRTDDTVLVGDYWNFRVHRFSSAGDHLAAYKNAAPGGVGAPYDIQTDPFDVPLSGLANYWVADQEQGDVVEFDHTGHVLHTLGPGGDGNYNHPLGCGNGAMTFPTHLTIDPSNGDLYISDVRCKNVWVFAHDGTYLRAFDWTGWKKETGLFTPTPRGIQMDENGNVYVMDLVSHRISVFDKAGQFQRIFPNEPSSRDLRDPRGLDIDTTHHVIYAVGSLKGVVLKYAYDGTLLKEWDSPTGSFRNKTDPKFNSIRMPAVDPATGNVFVSDAWYYGVWKFDANATPLPWASPPAPPADGGYIQQTGVAVDPNGTLFVAGSFDQRVQAFDTSLDCRSKTSCPAFKFKWGTRVNSCPTCTGFDYPKQLLFTDGYLWVSENDGNDIHAYLPDGTWAHRFGQQGPNVGQFRGGVHGLYIANQLVFAVDTGNCRLQVWDESFVLGNTSGLPLHAMGGCGTGADQMNAPRGVVADDASTAWVMESTGGKIAEWNWQTGTKLASYRPSCGGTLLFQPWGAAWDPAHQWIYIGDKGNTRIVRWSPTTHACDVVTVGGDTPEGRLSGPDFLNFAPDGKLYVSDNNKRVYSFVITG